MKVVYKVETKLSQIELEFNKEYQVFCIELLSYDTFVYVIDIEGLNYPRKFPILWFDVVDSRLSKSWVFHQVFELSGQINLRITFAEWAKDPYFYEKLFDGNKEAISFFMNNKIFLEEEL